MAASYILVNHQGLPLMHCMPNVSHPYLGSSMLARDLEQTSKRGPVFSLALTMKTLP